jgi:hypothetical protein
MKPGTWPSCWKVRPKGDVLAVARVAGIMAAKTSELIPLCHPLPISASRRVRTGRRVVADPHLGERQSGRADRRGDGSLDRGQRRGADGLRHAEGSGARHCDRGVRLLSDGGGPGLIAPTAEAPTVRARFVAPARRLGLSGALAFKPVEIMNEVAARKPPSDHNAKRDALRRFMANRGLTAHAWAKDAGLPVGAIYSFLHGRSHALTKSEEEKLARAADVSTEDLYRG